jgi:3-phosphoshikimate 1-carboxyvinyltransferase
MGGVRQVRLTKGTTPDQIVRIELPSSKSISNRALIIQHLSGNDVEILNLSEADDTIFLEKALSKGQGELWLGDAGTAARFMLAYSAVADGKRILTGSERLSQRPMRPLIDALRGLRAEINCLDQEGYLPVEVFGKKLEGGEVEIDPGISSQFISALMMIGPKLKKGLTIRFKGKPTSIPYLNMTKELMTRCGAKVKMESDFISIEPTDYAKATIEVEPDWSAASYFFSAVALTPALKILLKDLKPNSVQGDAKLAELYQPLGVSCQFSGEGLLLKNESNTSPKKRIDLSDNPDLAQTIAVTYAGMGAEVELVGLHTLKVKETDRLAAMKAELERMGVEAVTSSDSLTIKKTNKLIPNQIIHTYGDHRMAMAFAPLVFKTDLSLENPEVVSKSFPGFFEEFSKLGIKTYTVSEL